MGFWIIDSFLLDVWSNSSLGKALSIPLFHLSLIFRVSNGHNRGGHAGRVFEGAVKEPLIPSYAVCSGGPRYKGWFCYRTLRKRDGGVGLDFGSYEYTHPLTQRHKYSGGNPGISGTIEIPGCCSEIMEIKTQQAWPGDIFKRVTVLYIDLHPWVAKRNVKY